MGDDSSAAAVPTVSSVAPTVQTCGTEFTVNEDSLIHSLSTLSVSLSLLGSSFILFSYVMFPQLRTFPYRLIVCLSTADFFASFGYYLGKSTDSECTEGTSCVAAAAFMQFFTVATFMWTATIAFNIYAVMVLQKGSRVEENERYYHLVCWGLSGLLAIIAGATGSYGDAGNWCWIPEDRQLMRVFAYYLWLVLAMVFVVLMYVWIGRAVRGAAKRATINFRLRMYVAVFIIVRIWSVINRLEEWASGGNKIFALYLLHSAISPLQGFCNACVYGFNKTVTKAYGDWVRSWDCLCFQRSGGNVGGLSAGIKSAASMDEGSSFTGLASSMASLEPMELSDSEKGDDQVASV